MNFVSAGHDGQRLPYRRPKMESLSVQSPQEIKRLQRCISDLISVLALPAIWAGGEPSQIVSTLLDSLLGMLSLDFIYLSLHDSAFQGPQQFLRTIPGWDSNSLKRDILGLSEKGNSSVEQRVRRLLFADQEISTVSIPLGLQAEIGSMIAGSRRRDFPEQIESVILNIAANQASIGLQEARLLSEQKRLSAELDMRVAQRTRELAEMNDELREAHSQIARSEERWRSVFESSAIGVAITDLNGHFIATNPVYQQMLGYSEQEFRELTFVGVTHPDYLESNMMLIRELLEGVRRQFQIEKQYVRKDGGLVWVRNSVSIVPGTERVPRFLMALSEDITERKQAEERLRRSEAFLAEAQYLSRIGSFAWRVATNEITWSEQLYRIFEFERDTPVTLERIGTRIHPEDLPLFYEMAERAGRAVTDFEYEHRLLMPDTSIKYLHLIAHGAHDPQGRLEYIGAVQDVTHRRAAEEALSRARADLAQVSRITSLATLTASIAHEVNQPLSGIVTNASTCLRMLASDPPNVDGARETARRTIRDGNRASEVITRLRALFGKKEVQYESLDLNEATREVIALFLTERQRAPVVLRAELADHLPPVSGDRVQLQQVILNLLRNASDAMSTIEDRARELLITTHRDDGNRVRLSVKDVGIGFDQDTADQLFQAFYTTKADGMGIGLSVSRSIIEAHQGRLWGATNEGPGATFSFFIPAGAMSAV